MSVYTRRLFAGYPPAVGVSNIYTAPSGVAVVLRDMIYVNHTATPGVVQVGIRGAGNAFLVTLMASTGLATYDVKHLELRQALAVGDQIYVNTDITSLALAITGYVLA